MAITDPAPEHAGKWMLIIARDHGATPRLASRPEHMHGSRAAKLVRSIPERLLNDPQLGLFD
ncbi:hypothetical protein ACVI1L_000699 [Bradyrhizobium sp. USDA 4516]